MYNGIVKFQKSLQLKMYGIVIISLGMILMSKNCGYNYFHLTNLYNIHFYKNCYICWSIVQHNSITNIYYKAHLVEYHEAPLVIKSYIIRKSNDAFTCYILKHFIISMIIIYQSN